jgi:hypothetical protein
LPSAIIQAVIAMSTGRAGVKGEEARLTGGSRTGNLKRSTIQVRKEIACLAAQSDRLRQPTRNTTSFPRNGVNIYI